MKIRKTRWTVFLLILTMMFSLIVPVSASAAEQTNLSDTLDSYAKTEIDLLVAKGIISGYADGSFQPRKAITRAELAKILVLSLGLKEDAAKAESYSDVDTSSWYRGYVGALVASGITQGTSPTTFAPDANVTREELVVFFIRAFGLEKAASQLTASAAFADKEQIAEWAQGHVALASQIGFISGSDDGNGSSRFNPKDNAERQALARLAYEFTQHASQYVDKAKQLAAAQHPSPIKSVSVVNNTSVEVTFSSELATISKEEFAFDQDLKVVDIAFKTGSKSIVVLTTSAQKKDTSYKLSYKGVAVDQVLIGVEAAFFGGGGGGGGGAPAVPTVAQQLASGKALTSITISASGTYGPTSGATTVENLTVDPGPTGEVTLTNITVQNLEIRSGATSSIKLSNTRVHLLRVNAVNNGNQVVRVVVLGGTVVADTEVSSQAVLESSTLDGTLGKIRILSAATGKEVRFRGNIDGEITVEAPDTTIQIDPPSVGNALPTVIKSLKLKSGLTGTQLQLGAGTNLKAITTDTLLTVKGDPEAVWNLPKGNPNLEVDGQVQVDSKKLANQAINEAAVYSLELSAHLIKIDAADKAVAVARKYGAVDADFPNLPNYQTIKSSVIDFSNQISQYQLQFQAGDSASSVTKTITFPKMDGTGVTAVWQSDRSDLVSSWAPLNRPASGAGDATVELKVTFYKMSFSATKTFIITVKQHDSKIVNMRSLRGDLVLVEFDQPIINSKTADYQFDNNLQVQAVSQYPQLNKFALLTVSAQTSGTKYNVTYKQVNAHLSFVGSVENRCTSTTCPTDAYPVPSIPLPGVQVPGAVGGLIYEMTENGIKGISNATVELVGTNQKVQTDASGLYVFQNVSPGVTYSVKATFPGYSTAATGNFSIASGESYVAATLLLHTKPRSVTGLQTIQLGSAVKFILWTPYWVDMGNKITYKVYLNDKEVGSPLYSQYTVDKLEPGRYTFAVKACNDMGCSDPTAINFEVSMSLQVAGGKTYSVTDQVYSELVKTPLSENRFVISKGINVDYLLLVLKDSDSIPYGSNLKGTLDTSNASIGIAGSQTPVPGELVIINGITYYKIDFSKPDPKIGANIYAIYGLKYIINGQINNLQEIFFTVVIE
ncbi:S-layer homology domain-containing protein [Paenibacillus sp. HWE-109]|uniref:S-layer homology domain-containing protein n=1 Tax=Paenibacillus sp. HWE-109 TaxID=1306526 RepID=UPI001EE12C1C|nr:S-layer homology domain-containing protein [Paenibacillus sp. HWE-109]UKS25765.1 S-layer homology domain-containing protein [Paenibacillus sp. HWE-109]